MVGPDKLMFGTDWPWVEDCRKYVQDVDSVRRHADFMSAEDKGEVPGLERHEVSKSLAGGEYLVDLTIKSTRKLNSGVEIPVLGLGVFQSPPGAVTQKAVRFALEVGYRHFDTASLYGNEEDVGQAVRESGVPREEVFITTKLWNGDQGYESALRACDESLRRLGLGYIDLYIIHWPVPELRGDSWRALVELQKRAIVPGDRRVQLHHQAPRGTVRWLRGRARRRPGRVQPVPVPEGASRLLQRQEDTAGGVQPPDEGEHAARPHSCLPSPGSTPRPPPRS